MSDESTLSENIDVDFDVDAIEAEVASKPKTKKAFKTKWGSRVVEMKDPTDITWQELAEVENPVDLLKYAFHDEDKAHIEATPLRGETLGKVVEAYMKHYGMGEPGKPGAGLLSRSGGMPRR